MNWLPESLTLNLIKISWPISKIKFGGCLHQLPIVEEFKIAIQERYEWLIEENYKKCIEKIHKWCKQVIWTQVVQFSTKFNNFYISPLCIAIAIFIWSSFVVDEKSHFLDSSSADFSLTTGYCIFTINTLFQRRTMAQSNSDWENMAANKPNEYRFGNLLPEAFGYNKLSYYVLQILISDHFLLYKTVTSCFLQNSSTINL